jgi:hypothetical protein
LDVRILYRHTQRGTAILTGLLLIAPVVVIVFVLTLDRPVDWRAAIVVTVAVLALLAGTGWYFSSMTVEVTEDELRWHFGPGGYFRIPRSDIESVVPVRHPSFAGYGIRWMGPKRWTYIVSGRDTVEARLKSGGFTRLGTNDSDGLIAALTSNAKR